MTRSTSILNILRRPRKVIKELDTKGTSFFSMGWIFRSIDSNFPQLSSFLINLSCILLDSPEIPPSATAHELFRGFSFVNPLLFSEDGNSNVNNGAANPITVSGRMVDALLAKVFPSSFGFAFYEHLSHMCCLQNFYAAKLNSIADDYDIYEEIGTGSYSICKRCVHKATRIEFAVKVSFFIGCLMLRIHLFTVLLFLPAR